MHPDIDSLLTATASLTETEILALLTERYPDKVVFSTSFGMEDQVITDFISLPMSIIIPSLPLTIPMQKR